VTCRWCKWLDTAWPVLYEDETFVVLAPGAEHCTRNRLTLLPRVHVPVLTELPQAAMGDVLAGLSRLSLAVRTTCGVDDVAIQSHPADASHPDGHVHFHPVLHEKLRAIFGHDRGEHAMGEKDVLAIAEWMAHAGGALALDESV
jgi:diadenosine tetraphosphate (Ap4A) HIT family hydrolase